MGNKVEELHKAAVELGGHVAAAVRLSNQLDGMLSDLAHVGLSEATRSAIAAQALSMHRKFRSEHFRGLVDSMNATFGAADGLFKEEPLPGSAQEPAPEPDGDTPKPAPEPAPEPASEPGNDGTAEPGNGEPRAGA